MTGIQTSVGPLAVRTAAVIVAVLARVALGVLWMHEGIVKYRAGFGKSDILLVTQSAAQNPRVPGFYRWFTGDILAGSPTLFGFAVPLLEVTLGVLLIVGFLTVPVALVSVIQLCSYWFADQLITQYPIMMLLSVAVIALPHSSIRDMVRAIQQGERGDDGEHAHRGGTGHGGRPTGRVVGDAGE